MQSVRALVSTLLETDSDDIESEVIDYLDAETARIKELNRRGIVNADTVDKFSTFYHRTQKYRNKKGQQGDPIQVRRNGATKRWKRQPDQFRVPVKYGLYDYFYIDNSNAHEWSTTMTPEE